MGIPTLENEIMAVRLNLDMNITVTTMKMSTNARMAACCCTNPNMAP